ncbi:molybdenum ABC transporter ATP-binding protein, partial [Streptococcus pneumoniae]
QQQRVALARALVLEPKILCLDEPLSNLDAKLRVSLRKELKRLQKELGITTLYVTHDQEEALTLSDRIAVFNNGFIEQVGTPYDIYNQSATQFVCDFIGSINKISQEVLKKLQGGNKYFKETEGYIRLERVKLEKTSPQDLSITGVISDIEFNGVLIKYKVDLSNSESIHIIEKNDGLSRHIIKEKVTMYINPRDIMQF